MHSMPNLTMDEDMIDAAARRTMHDEGVTMTTVPRRIARDGLVSEVIDRTQDILLVGGIGVG